MKIALLGYGKEGQSTEKYLKSHFDNLDFDIFHDFTYDEISHKDYSSYDIVFRSPSVPPLHIPNESSLTRYFFEHCPCPIIGVTATKGKGTTCSFIKALLDAHGKDAYLVGNIGTTTLDTLDKVSKDSVVVYEMSSFQLWDMTKSPHIAVIGQIEPDHLNVHKNYADYLSAKANITNYQTPDDFLIYYAKNKETVNIASHSKAHKIPYPFAIPEDIKSAINIPGEHNVENAIAAISAVASYKNISPDEYSKNYKSEIIAGLSSFHGLPHRLEYLRELNSVKYYDDNFSTNLSSTKVAINAFPNENLVVIIGGRDKTDYEDLPDIKNTLSSNNIKKVILIGELGHKLFETYQDERFVLAETLKQAVNIAKTEAENITPSIVLMSPSAASFDMFENVYDRGEQFQKLVNELA